jgi:integrase
MARYRHWRSNEYDAKEHVRDPRVISASYTVTMLADDYLAHARETFRRAGTVTSHTLTVEYAMAALKGRFPSRIAADVKAHEIAALRDAMVWTQDRKGHRKRRALKTVNGRLYVIKQAFRWGAMEKGVIPDTVAGAIQLVRPLARGRSHAADPKQIRPVAWETVQATMRVCPQVVHDMVEVQWLTGMRSGELCIMRPVDIDRSGKVWLYKPIRHKSEHKEKLRLIDLGPRAQRVLKTYVENRTPAAYCFSPREAMDQMAAAEHAARRTPIGQGNRPGTNRKGDPQIAPGERYDSASYRRAIAYACDRADIDPWHPHQLRHAWATRVREEMGIEAASIGLGHSHIDATLLYAEAAREKAKEIARRVG